MNNPGHHRAPTVRWDRRKSDNPTLYNAIQRSSPFSRLRHPEEVVNVVLFLVSLLVSWFTGRTIVVDRGQLL